YDAFRVDDVRTDDGLVRWIVDQAVRERAGDARRVAAHAQRRVHLVKPKTRTRDVGDITHHPEAIAPWDQRADSGLRPRFVLRHNRQMWKDSIDLWSGTWCLGL